ncbi:MAG: MreB/Mrl family cell shape determining protein [Candidatus Dadabacteria bacterium]|nr:MreB/Mrl family cell shape determining protein [Candidatus Dadabacteria bacterium]NIQ14172.1 MreB/Mrl family cell shape determining protein [Candidatus Dadabacteria bacterium]
MLGLFSNDLAVDLGTANTLVFVKGKGIIGNEPSVVAVQEDSRGTKKLLAVGKEAKEMVGRTPGSIKAIRPLKDGVIADFDIAQKMLEYFIKKSHNNRKSLVRPRIIISVPIGITEVEKRAVRESAEAAGAREVYLIEETMSAAIGAGMPVTEPTGSMVVDIGGGTTGVAVISLAGIVVSKSIKVGGDKMDDAIMQYIKRNYNMLIGERTSEDVKKNLGKEIHNKEMKSMKVKGRDLRSGIPMIIEITSNEVKEALSEPVNDIIDAIKQTLERTPPELSADIVDTGIMLAGGGALLGGLDKLISEETGLPVKIAEDPLTCVVLGSGKALDELKILKEISVW